MNSLTVSSPYVSCHSVFSHDFRSTTTQFSLTIPCINKDSVFSVDFMHQLWICFNYLFHVSFITQEQFTIPCVKHDSNFAIKSMRRPWFYFRYRFHAWVVNYLTLSLPYGSCHSIFIDDFKVYRDSIFAHDLWLSSDKVFLPIPWVSHDFIFANDLMCRSWIQWRCRFHTSVVTQFSVIICRSRVTQFSLMISSKYWCGFHRRFLTSTITLFSLLISCIHRDLVFAVDSMRHLSLNFQWRFLDLQWLSFHRRFLHE